MLQISIHGTKGGYKVLNPQGLRLWDPAQSSPSYKAKGSIAYSMGYEKEYAFYTKTIIVKDGGGNDRTGNLNFTICLPYNKRMNGEDILHLLDELFDHYCNHYLPSTFTLDVNIKENWAFVDEALKKYEAKVLSNPDIKSTVNPSRKAAYCYYNNEGDLIKYFNAPYQEVFKPFGQIFYVELNKKGSPDNPLDVLEYSRDGNADLTGKIHFEKVTIEYTLKNYNSINDGGVKIQFYKNNLPAREGDRFVESDLVKVIYSKKNHEDLVIIGKLKGSELTKYLTFNQINNSFIINRDVKMLAKYPVHPGKNGSFNISGQLFSKTSDGQDVKHFISADEGFKFIGFENINGVLTAQYKKQANFIPLIWVGLGAALCSLIFALVYFLWPTDKNDTYKYRAIEYINGAEWNADTLNSLSKLCCLGADYDTGLCNKVSKAVEFRSLLDSGKLTTIKSGKSGFENAFEDAQSKVRSLLSVIVTIKDDDLKEMGKELREQKSVRTDLGSISGFIGDMKKLFTIEAAIDSLTKKDSLLLKAKRKELDALKLKSSLKEQLSEKINKKMDTQEKIKNGVKPHGRKTVNKVGSSGGVEEEPKKNNGRKQDQEEKNGGNG